MIDFFKDTDGKLSMKSLLFFMSFFPAAYVVVINAMMIGEGIYGLYLATYAGVYGYGKWVDYKAKKSENENAGTSDK